MPKAFVQTAIGGPEVEAFIDQPVPRPGPGQLVIAVRAAGVNPADWKIRSGRVRFGPDAPTFPAGLGLEAAGVIVGLGPDVHGFALGDEVLGTTVGGAFAEFALLRAAASAHKPAGLGFPAAAALPVAAATAFDAISQLAAAPGSVLLITGVGGGVGVAAAQLAKHAGVTVLGTASARKAELVGSLGVHWIEPGPGVLDRIRTAAPQGVDAILDLVGGDALAEVAPALATAADTGAGADTARGAARAAAAAPRLVSTADDAGATALGGVAVRRTFSAETLAQVAALAAGGVLVPQVSAVLPFERAGQALRAVERGHATGKVVIEVGR